MGIASRSDDQSESEPPKMTEQPQAPQDLAALDFMVRKGLDHIRPVEVQVIIPGRAWLYCYDLDDGAELDVRIEWSETDEDWDIKVVDFRKD